MFPRKAMKFSQRRLCILLIRISKEPLDFLQYLWKCNMRLTSIQSETWQRLSLCLIIALTSLQLEPWDYITDGSRSSSVGSMVVRKGATQNLCRSGNCHCQVWEPSGNTRVLSIVGCKELIEVWGLGSSGINPIAFWRKLRGIPACCRGYLSRYWIGASTLSTVPDGDLW